MKRIRLSLVLTIGILTLNLAILSAMLTASAQTNSATDTSDTTNHAVRDTGFTGSHHFDWGLLGLPGLLELASFRRDHSNSPGSTVEVDISHRPD